LKNASTLLDAGKVWWRPLAVITFADHVGYPNEPNGGVFAMF